MLHCCAFGARAALFRFCQDVFVVYSASCCVSSRAGCTLTAIAILSCCCCRSLSCKDRRAVFGSCFGDNLDTFGVWRIDSRAVCIQFLTDHIWSGDPISRALSPFSYQTQTTCKAPISVVRCCGSVSCHCLFWQCVFHFPLSVTGFGFVVFFLRICYLLATEFSAASASGA